MVKKILIADDEKDVLMVLEKRLSDAGYGVVKAENGEDAVTTARSEHPDLIILDVMMPGMDGAGVADILKHDKTTKDIPIIFLTCLLTKEEAEERCTIEGGCFVAKPFDTDKLLEIIDKKLDVYG